MTSAERKELVIDAVAVLIGSYNIYQKYAAVILLKMLLPKNITEMILHDDGIYPIDRNDARVRNWVKKVKEKNVCEMCGSTESLEAHHIVRWSDYPKGRIDINNGMCVCIDCHADLHKYEKVHELIKTKKRRCRNANT